MAQLNMIQALNAAMDIALGRDPAVVVLGEDVGYFGGVFRVTDGLQRKYGQRILLIEATVVWADNPNSFLGAVLDDEDRVSLVDELLQNGDEPRDVVEVEPRRRFVEDVDRLSRSGADQFFCELDPLRLASRKSRRGLAESQIIESHMGEKFQFFPNRGDRLKKF